MKIDKQVPMPEQTKRNKGGKIKYPWRDMEVGDSVFFNDREEGRIALSAANKFAKRNDAQFVSMGEGDGLRIWKSA